MSDFLLTGSKLTSTIPLPSAPRKISYQTGITDSMSADQVHYQNAVNIFLRIKILQYQVGCRNVACIFRFVKINVYNDAYGPMGC